jgi:hypothetical protein
MGFHGAVFELLVRLVAISWTTVLLRSSILRRRLIASLTAPGRLSLRSGRSVRSVRAGERRICMTHYLAFHKRGISRGRSSVQVTSVNALSVNVNRIILITG